MPPQTQVSVGTQELDFRFDVRRHSAGDAIERVQRVLELALLEMDAREAVGRIVPYRFVHGALEHGRDRATGAMVHAIVELEVAYGELRLAQMVIQRIESGFVDAAMLPELCV
jgi:hypothetical protein